MKGKRMALPRGLYAVLETNRLAHGGTEYRST